MVVVDAILAPRTLELITIVVKVAVIAGFSSKAKPPLIQIVPWRSPAAVAAGDLANMRLAMLAELEEASKANEVQVLTKGNSRPLALGARKLREAQVAGPKRGPATAQVQSVNLGKVVWGLLQPMEVAAVVAVLAVAVAHTVNRTQWQGAVAVVDSYLPTAC
jgi:hypothetical protein